MVDEARVAQAFVDQGWRTLVPVMVWNEILSRYSVVGASISTISGWKVLHEGQQLEAMIPWTREPRRYRLRRIDGKWFLARADDERFRREVNRECLLVRIVEESATDGQGQKQQ